MDTLLFFGAASRHQRNFPVPLTNLDAGMRHPLFQPVGFCFTSTNKYHLHNLNYLCAKVRAHKDGLKSKLPKAGAEDDAALTKNAVLDWAMKVSGDIMGYESLSKLWAKCVEDLPNISRGMKTAEKQERRTGQFRNKLTKGLYKRKTPNRTLFAPDPVDLDMSHLFKSLEPVHILRVIRAILNNEQILLFSANIHILFPVCETLLALIYPFKMVTPYIPILPIDIAQAEEGGFFNNNFSSFMFGLEKSVLTRCGRLSDSIVQVDLDTNAVWGGSNKCTESPDLPFDLTLKLFTDILRHGCAPFFEIQNLKPLHPPNNVDAAIARSCKETMTLLGLDGDNRMKFEDAEPEQGSALVDLLDVLAPVTTLASSISSKLDNTPCKVGMSILHMSGRNLNAIRRNESVGRGQSIIFSNGGFDSSDEDSVTLEATSIINSSERPQFNQVGIQSKFMKFMLSCFKSYAMYMKSQEGNHELVDDDTEKYRAKFDVEGFLHAESRSDQASPFFAKFVKCQMFNCFVNSIECRLNQSVFADAAYQKMQKAGFSLEGHFEIWVWHFCQHLQL